jgi:ATP-binding cassette subfamily B protein
MAWPAGRLVEALDVAARRCGLPRSKTTETAPTWGAAELEGPALDRWVEAAAGWLGLEAEPFEVEHPDVEAMLLRAAPAMVRLPSGEGFLLLLGRRGRSVTLIAPDLSVRRVAVTEIRDVLCRAMEAPIAAQIEGWLGDVVSDPRGRRRVREASVRELLQKERVTGCYMIRIPPGASFWAQMRLEGIQRGVVIVLAAHAAQFGLGICAWYTLGAGVFGAGIDRSWLIAWALFLLSAIPFQVLSVWVQGRVVLGVGTLLKRRLLVGALRVDETLLRREGTGQLLGRAAESSAVEALALSGGVFAILALVEFAVLTVVLLLGPGGALHALALIVWGLLTMAAAWQCYQQGLRWTHARRDMTNDLVEQMVGHRTRLAQQSPARWHDGEDEALERYLALSAVLDKRETVLRAMPQAWFLVGLAGFLPSLLYASTSAAALAVAVGGTLLGASALSRLAGGLAQLSGAAIAWKEVQPLYEAAATAEIQASPDVVASHLAGRQQHESTAPLLDATDLVFSFPGRPQPVVRQGSLRVKLGDRVLLEGPSGGGKSTFASLLSGLRRPQAGLLLLEGLDWQTLGPGGWRRRIGTAPQYHDNHVLSETFMFNLLMGRHWPPVRKDFEDATEICRALGLGDLLERMPAGLMQMVGDSGWRLSHGERSRMFMARALLQDASLLILDESFAALDPRTLEQCLRYVMARAPALVVIAHP